MFDFKKPKSQKSYETERAYLKSVFYRNREKIVKAFGSKDTFRKFFNNVQSQKIIGGGLTTQQALRKLAHSEDFTPRMDRLRENAMKGLKTFGKTKLFQSLARDERGHYTKFNPEKLMWDARNKMYVYDGRITIDFTHSPEDIILGVIE